MDKRYTHDCDRCTFLGQYEEYDLYVCPSQKGFGSVIARFGDDGPEYKSLPLLMFKSFPDIGKHSPELQEAYDLAVSRGILK